LPYLLQQLLGICHVGGEAPTQRDPTELATIKGATKRTRQPGSLTVEEFQAFASNLAEPFRTIALLCVLLGLRIGECPALKCAERLDRRIDGQFSAAGWGCRQFAAPRFLCSASAPVQSFVSKPTVVLVPATFDSFFAGGTR
jgi:hypothetical protein